MPYYNAGDYYGRGDYYQAGGLFSFLGKAIGSVAKFATNLVPGPIGAIARAVVKVARPGEKFATLTSPYQPPPGEGEPPPAPGSALVPFAGGQVPMIGGGGGIITQSPLGTPVSPAGIAMQVARLRHTRPNKSTYVTRGGGTSHWPPQLIVHPKGTEMVRPRRLNVANPRALRRALRRAAGFVKLARRAHVKLTSFRGSGKKKKK